MGGKCGGMFRRARVRDLRPLIVADARLDVVGVFCGEREDFRFLIEDEALADDAPVAEVAGDAQIRQLDEQIASEPRAVCRAAAGVSTDMMI
jgi:hypothetical protein